MKLLRISDVAQRIGVHESTIRRWCQKGAGPAHIKIGRGHYLFDPQTVERWLTDLKTQGGPSKEG
jgi:excisionase family DNA binding protein